MDIKVTAKDVVFITLSNGIEVYIDASTRDTIITASDDANSLTDLIDVTIREGEAIVYKP